LRAWAQACHPEFSPEALDALPVIDLLPGLGVYLQTVRDRVGNGSFKPSPAAIMLYSVHAWMQRNQQQLR
jgi:hypothetical protein